MSELLQGTQSVVLFIITIVVCWILLQIKNLIFKKMRANRDDMKIRFIEHSLTTLIVIFGVLVAISTFGGFTFMWKTMLGGTAFFSAVVIFMAQDVIKDFLAGLMISIFEPFEIGDRIQLEDGTAGIVEDVTMRHTVLVTMGTLRIIVPNRRLQDMIINNYSFDLDCRSRMFTFAISYPSDVDFARDVARQAIMESPYSYPGRKTKNGMDYGEVYFMDYAASSLVLKTIVYYLPGCSTETMITDINSRVDKAFWDNNISFPYPHVTVMNADANEVKECREEVLPAVMWKTPIIKVYMEENGIERAMEETTHLGEYNGLNKKQVMRLRLLGEELLRLMPEFVGDTGVKYWAEHKLQEYRIHVGMDVAVNNKTRKKLLSLSTTGKNAANQSFSDNIRNMIVSMLIRENFNKNNVVPDEDSTGNEIEQRNIFRWSLKSYRWQLENNHGKGKENGKEEDENGIVWEELEHSIISKIADDISISITATHIEVVAVKIFR